MSRKTTHEHYYLGQVGKIGAPPPPMAESVKADHDELTALRAEVERLKKLDREASEVEQTIIQRTHFTGEPPYVGWSGLNLALVEHLDRRDRMWALVHEAQAFVEEWCEDHPHPTIKGWAWLRDAREALSDA